jgi:hypothetical protein
VPGGCFVIAGRTESFGEGDYDCWVLRLDSSGRVQWAKTYGGAGHEAASAIRPTPDGGYLVAGWTESFGAGGKDFWVLKLDPEGDVIWQESYGGAGDEALFSALVADDGSCLVLGETNSFGAGPRDALVVKLDSQGHVLWARTYGGPGDDRPRFIRQTHDGGYVIVGHTTSFGSGYHDGWLVKLDSDGNVVWEKAYGGSNSDIFWSIALTPDGGFVVCGETRSFGQGGLDAWVLRLDYQGDVVWQRCLGGESWDAAYGIHTLPSGNLLVAGWTESYGAGGTDIWILELNLDGEVVAERTFGGPSDDVIWFTPGEIDYGFAFAGETMSFSVGEMDGLVLIITLEGTIPECDFVTSTSTVSIETVANAQAGFPEVLSAPVDTSGTWAVPLEGEASVTPICAFDSWALTYGRQGLDYATSASRASDGGYFVTGWTRVSAQNSFDVWIMKVNALGEVLWQENYGGSDADTAFAMKGTGDNGLVIAGTTWSFGASGQDGWVLKLDGDGGLQWQKAYRGPGRDVLRSVVEAGGDGYVMAGYTESNGMGMMDGWVIRVDGNGDRVWEKVYGLPSDDKLYAVEEAEGGGWIVVGETNSSGEGGSDGWVLRLDDGGAILWQRTYGGPGDDRFFAVLSLVDDGALLVGETTSYGAGGEDAWVVRVDYNGNIIWQRAYGGAMKDVVRAVAYWGSGNYVIAGETRSFGFGSDDAWIVALDSSGDILWERTYGGTGADRVMAVSSLGGCFLVTGETTSFGNGLWDVWLLKLDASGDIDVAGCEIIGNGSSATASTGVVGMPSYAAVAGMASVVVETSAMPVGGDGMTSDVCHPSGVETGEDEAGRSAGVLVVNPHPLGNVGMVRFDLGVGDRFSLDLVNAAGRKVARLGEGVTGAGEQSVEVHVGDIPTGVYFLRLEVEGRLFKQKLVVVR